MPDINRRKFLVGSAVVGGAAVAAPVLLPAGDAYASGPTGTWTAATGFSSTQGANQWFYQQRPLGGGAFTDLTVYNGTPPSWRSSASNEPWVGSSSFHPGTAFDAVRKWVAPSSGMIAVTGRIAKAAAAGNGTVVTVQRNSTVLLRRTVTGNDTAGYAVDAELGAVSVRSGDAIYFIVSNNGEYSSDETIFNPSISYVSPTGIWQASMGYDSTQGANQWSYQQRPVGGGSYTNLTFLSGAWRNSSGSEPWISPEGFHPGVSFDAVRKWTAPSSGTIAITGRAYKQDTGGGNGVVVSVLKNSTTVWTKTIGAADGVGYSVDAALSAVSVSAGDSIYFIVSNNGEYTYDATIFDPVIQYSTIPVWNLNTTDTNVSLTVRNNRPVLLSVTNPGTGWNWVRDSQPVPLLAKVFLGATSYEPNWTYQDAVVTTTGGTTVTLRFTSSTPALELKSTWTAASGSGPVVNSVTVQNNTGSSVTYQYPDVRTADLTVTPSAAASLWRFNRSSVASGADSGFDTGVFTTALGQYAVVGSTVSNDYNAGNYVLPFAMLDAGGAQGLYFGYEWDFGVYEQATYGDQGQIYTRFLLGNGGAVTEAAGVILNVPDLYLGTYTGDTDDGSNSMKRWFWNNKMTPTLRTNANEPLVEFDVNLYDESSISAFYAANPLSSWGVELIKEDAWWTSDVNSDSPFGWAWNPNPSAWPNGMTLGTMTHNAGMKLALYMGNSYNHADLATAAGRAAQKSALLTRYDNGWYDYWRSDMNSETQSNEYLSHEGLMEVLDYMIANRPNFRWENCSAGGSKKSFDLCQRMTFMTVEDSGVSNTSVINYRKAYYANSYMINSVQLKDDNSLPSPSTTAGAYIFRTAMMGAWLYGSTGSTVNLAGQYAAAVALYKSKQRPILRGANVYHVLPMPDNVNWDGMQFFNPTLNKGSVFLFHPSSSAPSSQTIKLKGLNPTATYTLTFQDRTAQNRSATGAVLMSTGITVTGLTADLDSEIIWIN